MRFINALKRRDRDSLNIDAFELPSGAAQLWEGLDGHFRSEAALKHFLSPEPPPSDFFLKTSARPPVSTRYARLGKLLHSLSVERVSFERAPAPAQRPSSELEGQFFDVHVEEEFAEEHPEQPDYGPDEEIVRAEAQARVAEVRGWQWWLEAHPLRRFPPLPSRADGKELEALATLLFAVRQSEAHQFAEDLGRHYYGEDSEGLAEADTAFVDDLTKCLDALVHARRATSLPGPGPASSAAPSLFPHLTALSIVGASNLASVDLGCCPNLERLSLRLCGSLARIELGGAGRRLVALEIGGVALGPDAFRGLVDGLSRAGCRLQECRLGVPPTDAKHLARLPDPAAPASPPPPPSAAVNAGEQFEQRFIESSPGPVALGFRDATCFISTSLSTLLAYPSLLGELRVLSLHGGLWQRKSRLKV